MEGQMTIFDLERKTCRSCIHWRKVYGYADQWLCFQAVICKSSNPDQEACGDFEEDLS